MINHLVMNITLLLSSLPFAITPEDLDYPRAAIHQYPELLIHTS